MKIFLIAFIVTTTTFAFCQIPEKLNKLDDSGKKTGTWIILYDKDWNEIQDTALAEYHRIINFRNGTPQPPITDYYKSGNKQMEVWPDSSDLNNDNSGWFVYYHPSGIKRAEGKEIEKVEIGLWHYFDEKKDTILVQDYGFSLKDTNSWEYWYYLGSVFEERSQFEKGTKYFQRSLNIFEQQRIQEDSTHGFIQKHLADCFSSIEQYLVAEKLYKRSLNNILSAFGLSSREYLAVQNEIAILYRRRREYDKVEKLYLEALKIKKEYFPKDSLDIAITLNNLGVLYYGWNKLSEALEYEILALEIVENSMGKYNSKYADYEESLSKIYLESGETNKAWDIAQEVVKVYEKIGQVDIHFTRALENLSAVASVLGKDSLVENCLLKCLKIEEQILGNTSPEYINTLCNLSKFYTGKWNYVKAEAYALQAIEIMNKLGAKNEEDYAIALNQLGVIYYHTSNYEKAAEFWERAKRIRATLYGKKNKMYAESLNNLASLYANTNQHKNAEQYYKEALSVYEEVYGKESYFYIRGLHSLGYFYLHIGRYDMALIELNEVLKYCKNTDKCPRDDYAIYLQNLAGLYQDIGNSEKALPLYNEIIDLFMQRAKEDFNYMSEKEKIHASFELVINFFLLKEFCFQYYSKNKSLARDAYNAELNSKSFLLRSIIDTRSRIINSRDAVTLSHFDSLLSVMQSKVSSAKKGKASKITESEDIEKQINQISSKYETNNSIFQVNWKNILNSLRPSEAAIEFGLVLPVNINNKIPFYCAYLINTGDDNPRQIFLFDEHRLDSILQLSDYTTCPNNRCASERINYLLNYSNRGKVLYDLIWGKIEPYLKDAKTIYFSPTGKLYKINFAAIPTSDSTVLSDKYHLVQLNSTREIALESFKPVYVNDTSSIALFGGIKYDMDTTDLKNATATYHKEEQDQPFAFASRSYTADSSSRGTYFGPLPATLEEVEFIKPLFKKSNLFTGAQATEEAFKSLQGKQAPDILHIATHGFFFKGGEIKKDHKGKILEFEFSNDPLIRSGLLMAGGNLKWKGEEIPEGIEDGILTAKEVAALNLSNAKLVVLSACETGLGDIQGSEGVYGLQRAFKAAGADYLLMSLWSVPDKPTAEFMQTFYSKLKTGSDIQTAFEQTQTAMKLQYKNEPYNWAGFVLVR